MPPHLQLPHHQQCDDGNPLEAYINPNFNQGYTPPAV